MCDIETFNYWIWCQECKKDENYFCLYLNALIFNPIFQVSQHP